MLSRKQPLFWDTPEQRLAEFKQAFGDDLAKLDREFLRLHGRRPLISLHGRLAGGLR